jgi:WD40 repeat protein
MKRSVPGFGPDGQQLEMASVDDRVMIFDVAARRRLIDLQSKFALGVSWSPDGSLIASGSGENLVTVWDARTFETLFSVAAAQDIMGRPIGTGAQGYVINVEWSPDGSMPAASDRGSGIQGQGFVHIYRTRMFSARSAADWLKLAEEQVERSPTAAECKEFALDGC